MSLLKKYFGRDKSVISKKSFSMKNLFMAIGLLISALICSSQTNKIPLNAWNWYELNTQGTGTTDKSGLKQLSDNILTEPVFMGWGKMFPNYNCIYEFKDLKDVSISKIRLYDGSGSFADKPMKLYARTSASEPDVLLATFTGDAYNTWKEITLSKPVRASYLVINTYGNFPNEIELYGAYGTVSPVSRGGARQIKFGDMAGINAFSWDFLENWDDINKRDTIYEPKMKLMQAFNQYRDYIDWEKIETNKGVYAFNPTQSGTWNYDRMYKRLKQEGKTVLACLKTVPNWFLQQYYPADQRDNENIPAPYGSDLLKPASYVLQARMAFQFAARYGSNKNVSSSLLGAVLTGLLYPNNPASGSRTREIGMDLIKYMECDNERDKWWKGRKAYQTAWEYAANLSAFYDGHKNTMGSGVGVKNADPNMKVVIGGTAATSTDYIKGIIDWCKLNRGYNSDGSVNLCFDVINYHCYSFQDGATQYGSASRGSAPELSGAGRFAADFVKLGKEYNVEVWVTEGGYDVNQASPLHAPSIAGKTPLDVQADWILRTALLYARQGINRMFFYTSYDEDINNGGQFGTSGLLDKINRKRKPAADFLYQSKTLLKDYVYKETLNSNPFVDRYELNGQSIYAMVVPDEKNRAATYSLPVSAADSLYIYTPKAGTENMLVQKIKLTSSSVNIPVTETPVFVKPVGTRRAIVATPDTTATPPADSTIHNPPIDSTIQNPPADTTIKNPPVINPPADSTVTHPPIDSTISQPGNGDHHIRPVRGAAKLQLFPNPTNGELNFALMTPDKGLIAVHIIDIVTGRVLKQYNFDKPSDKFSTRIRVDDLRHGVYLLEVKTQTRTLTQKFIKI